VCRNDIKKYQGGSEARRSSFHENILYRRLALLLRTNERFGGEEVGFGRGKVFTSKGGVSISSHV